MSRPWPSLALLLALATPAAADAPALYAEHCASCHGADRLGATGPALLPESLARLRPEAMAAVIRDGRAATQMSGFAGMLSDAEMAELAALIRTPPAVVPSWGVDEIEASRTILVEPGSLPDRPQWHADPLNLFVVVEAGDHHVTILDGDRFEPLARFPSRFALHGGPKFSPDGRFVTLMSRDGWITRYDLWSLQPVAEVRAGINSRNIAVSDDGRVIAVANYLPNTLVLLDAATLAPLAVKTVDDRFHKVTSRVSAVYQAAPRRSFVLALKDLPEIWEISYSPDPPATFAGLVHSYETGMVEGLADSTPFPVRRIPLEEPLDDFFFDPSYDNLVGSSRDGGRGVVVNLDVRREIAELPLPGLPHLGSGISFVHEGRRVLATPHLDEAAISVVDLETWKVVKRIDTIGPGFFMRGHEASPYAWVDVSLGPEKDKLQILDERTLELVRTLQPAPGKTTGHVEFTRDGRYALVSVSELDGELVVYDAATFEVVKRLPMRKPVGKYNVGNKIGRSDGTSH
ncbi:MAG: cytochrome D1 domain-containing protein [Geminicoccaceae bacterium]